MALRFGGKRATYQCDKRREQDGLHGICWSVPAAPIDCGVETHVLEALTENNLDISLAVLNELEQNAQEQDHQWQIRLERARYEANRAERQFDVVEPENRLVARTLEQRWNEKLRQLAELEQAYAQARQVQRLERVFATAPKNSALSLRPTGYLAVPDHNCTHCAKKCWDCWSSKSQSRL